MSAEPAWGINKTARFKNDASAKKDKFMANAGPGSYEIHVKDLKKEP